MVRYSIPGQERWEDVSESNQYPEEPVIIVHYTIPPISFPTQWRAEEDIFNDALIPCAFHKRAWGRSMQHFILIYLALEECNTSSTLKAAA